MLMFASGPWVGGGSLGFGIFGGGYNGSVYTSAAYTYAYGSNVVTTTTALSYSGVLGAAGNKNFAIFYNYAPNSPFGGTSKYAWGTAAVTTGTAVPCSSFGTYYGGGLGVQATGAKGYFLSGNTGYSSYATIASYTYATDSVTNLTSSTIGSSSSISPTAAAGNGVFANIWSGVAAPVASTLTFSTNAWATSSVSWPSSWQYAGAAGNTTMAVFVGVQGGGYTTQKIVGYWYSTNSAALTTNLTYAPGTNASGTGNASQGVFAGGLNGSYLANTSIFKYATVATASGTNLPAALGYQAGASNTNAGIF